MIPGRFDSAFDQHDRRVAAELTGKLAAHAHDRIEERTSFHRSHVDLIQRAVDTLGLEHGTYHLPLRHQDGRVLGYAQFKSVPNRKYPVLATVLGPEMSPGGVNIEDRIKLGRFVENQAAESPPMTEATRKQPPTDYLTRRAFTPPAKMPASQL